MLQAQIVSRKKEAAAEALNDARNELHSLKAELAEKQQQLRDSDNQGMLKPDQVGQQRSSLRLMGPLIIFRHQPISLQ